MAKSLNDITKVKNLDLLIEVLDTRAITASSNEALINKFNKPVLKIALKKDLSDVIENNNVLIGSINDKNFKNKIFKKIDEFLKGKKEKLIKKGLLHPQFYIMVVGLPNIGKSSLINFLSNKNKVEVANKPGVTRTKQVIKLNEQYFIYDTPGILFKNIESDEIGYKLSLIGAIKKEILPINDISK
jgi:ribosome biogenesis GTPase A